MAEPHASRPHMPGYGVLAPDEGTGLLPWSWAAERLAAARNYWVVSTWPDGRPHAMPVWGVWDAERLWFSTAPRSRKARNLTADPRCVVTTEDASEPVVIEGEAERVEDAGAVSGLAERMSAKYGERITPAFLLANAVFRVRARTAFAIAHDDFTGSPTRWRFG